MTFHPFGRTSSVRWFHNAKWLDFNMFKSGHRRYDQTRGDGDDTAQASVAEDNWRYVEELLIFTVPASKSKSAGVRASSSPSRIPHQ